MARVKKSIALLCLLTLVGAILALGTRGHHAPPLPPPPAPVRAAAGVPIPQGPAGGGLAGTYPNPTIRNGDGGPVFGVAATAPITAMTADGSVTVGVTTCDAGEFLGRVDSGGMGCNVPHGLPGVGDAGEVFTTTGGAAKWQLASPLPAASGFGYVSKAGSDSNPGTYELPWLTIGHALTVASSLASSSNYIEIRVFLGYYNENVALPPYVYITGESPSSYAYSVGFNGLSLKGSGAWAVSSASAALTNIAVGTGSGSTTLNFAAAGSLGGNSVTFQGVALDGGTAITGSVNGDTVYITQSYESGAFTEIGLTRLWSYQSVYYGTATVSSSPTTGNDAGSLSTIWESIGDTFLRQIIVHGLVNGINIAWDGSTNSDSLGGMTLDGSHITCTGGSAMFPTTPTLTNGATFNCTLTTSAFGTGYAPTTSGNWSSVPTAVGGALDSLAAIVPAGAYNLANGSGLVAVAHGGTGAAMTCSSAQFVQESSSTALKCSTLSQDGTLGTSGALTVTQMQNGEVTCGASTGTLTEASGATAPGLIQTAPGTDTAPNAMTIQAQGAEPAAATNLTGAKLNLKAGAGATTGGIGGGVDVDIEGQTYASNIVAHPFRACSSGTCFFAAGPVVSNSTNAGAIWLGSNANSGTTLGNANIYLASSGALGIDSSVVQLQYNGNLRFEADTNGSYSNSGTNLGINGTPSGNGGGSGVLVFNAATTAPTTAPSTSNVLWEDSTYGTHATSPSAASTFSTWDLIPTFQGSTNTGQIPHYYIGFGQVQTTSSSNVTIITMPSMANNTVCNFIVNAVGKVHGTGTAVTPYYSFALENNGGTMSAVNTTGFVLSKSYDSTPSAGAVGYGWTGTQPLVTVTSGGSTTIDWTASVQGTCT